MPPPSSANVGDVTTEPVAASRTVDQLGVRPVSPAGENAAVSQATTVRPVFPGMKTRRL